MKLNLETRPESAPWRHPETYWPALTAATLKRSAPVGVIGLEALASNAHDLLERAQGTPIRVASKSVRVRGVLDAVLALPGFRGVMAYTLAEAIWLADTGDERYEDILVGYPTADRTAIARLASDEKLAARITLMVDDIAQLVLVDAVAPRMRAMNSGSRSSSTRRTVRRCSGISACGARRCTNPRRSSRSRPRWCAGRASGWSG
ncbi:hypothetical protein GCM10025881_30400 [Pseudolysinimonas kribbensis]|uniref:Alanine racemase N-terminal domain-containing protein n=1 Tax=Pseudolysinimonas kribbensis TaxID=433641 RepID=A0ABQ6KCL5_9MICO|nr:hypothetical protein GCM10025881_30400 [Pseudolysinimonas kribbensis]